MSSNKPKRRGGGASAGRQAERRLSVRAIRRDPPDLRKLAQALISIAQAEAAAQAEHEAGAACRLAASAEDDLHSKEAA